MSFFHKVFFIYCLFCFSRVGWIWFYALSHVKCKSKNPFCVQRYLGLCFQTKKCTRKLHLAKIDRFQSQIFFTNSVNFICFSYNTFSYNKPSEWYRNGIGMISAFQPSKKIDRNVNIIQKKLANQDSKKKQKCFLCAKGQISIK